jgi:hypothetical protein
MLPKTPEFLDSMCKASPLNKGWYLINVKDYGIYVWQENDPERVLYIASPEVWFEENGIVENSDGEITTCAVRNVLNKRARIEVPEEQTIEVWLNIIIADNLKQGIRVEAYTDQNAAIIDAEAELEGSIEVHTKRITVKVP